MTVTYEEKLTRIFFYWRASVWEVVWKDLLVFCILFAALSCLYRFGLNDSQQVVFESLVLRVDKICDSLLSTVAFLLGFFVQTIVTRWWTQFELLPWPEELINSITFAMPGIDAELNLIRKTVARYFCLTTALAGRLLSTSLKRRFPNEEDIIIAGLMTKNELAYYDVTAREVKFFIPMIWAQQALCDECTKRKVPAPHSALIEKEISECITRFRKLFCYDWVNIPLVYTQCVCFAVYVYLGTCIFGKQFIKRGEEHIDYYVPVFTLLQLIFYIGWLRVGLRLMKPFGDDDEDFELSSLLDRHIEVAFELADLPMRKPPKIEDVVIPTAGINDGGAVGVLPAVAAIHKKIESNGIPKEQLKEIWQHSREMLRATALVDNVVPPIDHPNNQCT